MLKRIVRSFTDAAGRGAGYVVGGRAGNDLHDWVRSGEAKRAAGRLGKDAAEVAREAKDALVGAGEEAGRALKETAHGLRAALTGDDAGDAAPLETGARAGAGGIADDELSEDDRAALRARERSAAAEVVARCAHCDAPVRVPAGAELARCSSCQKRFWIER